MAKKIKEDATKTTPITMLSLDSFSVKQCDDGGSRHHLSLQFYRCAVHFLYFRFSNIVNIKVFGVFSVALNMKYYYTFLPKQFKISPHFVCIIGERERKMKISRNLPIPTILMIVLATIIIISAPSAILPMDEMFV